MPSPGESGRGSPHLIVGIEQEEGAWRIRARPQRIHAIKTPRTQTVSPRTQLGCMSARLAGVMVIHDQRPATLPQCGQCLQADGLARVPGAETEAFRFEPIIRVKEDKIAILEQRLATSEPLCPQIHASRRKWRPTE